MFEYQKKFISCLHRKMTKQQEKLRLRKKKPRKNVFDHPVKEHKFFALFTLLLFPFIIIITVPITDFSYTF